MALYQAFGWNTGTRVLPAELANEGNAETKRDPPIMAADSSTFLLDTPIILSFSLKLSVNGRRSGSAISVLQRSFILSDRGMPVQPVTGSGARASVADIPFKMESGRRANDTAAGDEARAGFQSEAGNALEPFLEKNDDLQSRQVHAGTDVNTGAERAVRLPLPAEIDVHRAAILPLVDAMQRRGG